MDRLNQLKQYMEFYKENGLGPSRPSMFNGVPVIGNELMAGSDRMNMAKWATDQVSQENQFQSQNQPPPDFYGQQPQMAQPQYVQPQMPQDRNPYSGMQPAGGMNGDVTNYLRKLLGGSRPGGMGNSTLGIRG